MSDNVGKTRPQILSPRPSLKDIPWILGVLFVDISWTFEDIFELCSMSRQIGMSTRISVICPVQGHVADMSRTNETKISEVCPIVDPLCLIFLRKIKSVQFHWIDIGKEGLCDVNQEKKTIFKYNLA
jgi:hypothetical protein